MMGKQMKRYLLIASMLATSLLPSIAQLSSENYVQTSTRISDSQMQTVTQYYDGLGRPTEKVEHGVTPDGTNLVHLQEYDGLGRVFTQTLLGKESVAYLYNIRNWKTDIIGQNFNQLLAYNHSNGSLIPRKSLYNGNISAMSWQVGDGVKKGFHFDYDSQNMLTGAEYGEGSALYESNGNYDERLSYDKMGNVLTLLRYGLRDNGQYGLIDNLSYVYNGNQLLKVDDAVSGPYYAGAFHFVDGADESVEYTYDANGNMVSDKNKGIGSIPYDINNQPCEISFSDGRKSSYVYDSEGRKHSVSYNLTAMTSAQPLMPVMQSVNAVSANATNGQKTINYCDNIIYDDGETIVLNDIGYAKYDKQGNLSFHYYLQDHLGNNRVVMNEDGTIEQVNDYYPTGALMGSSQNGEVQRYKYNGKELDRLNGLDWYDYGARNYDAALVVWNGVDKLSERYYPISSYSYCLNNFVNNMDKDGKRVLFAKGTSQVFKQYFKQAITYLKSHKADGLFAKLQASNVTIYIGEQKERAGGSEFLKNQKMILWDPLTCVITSNGNVISATTILNHEADHALQEITNPLQKKKDYETFDEQYANAEEKRVITGSEQRTARALGEIKDDDVTRTDHTGFPYKTESPISVKPYGFQIVEYRFS